MYCISWALVTEQFVGAKGTGNSFKHVKHSAFHPAWAYLVWRFGGKCF